MAVPVKDLNAGDVVWISDPTGSLTYVEGHFKRVPRHGVLFRVTVVGVIDRDGRPHVEAMYAQQSRLCVSASSVRLTDADAAELIAEGQRKTETYNQLKAACKDLNRTYKAGVGHWQGSRGYFTKRSFLALAARLLDDGTCDPISTLDPYTPRTGDQVSVTIKDGRPGEIRHFWQVTDDPTIIVGPNEQYDTADRVRQVLGRSVDVKPAENQLTGQVNLAVARLQEKFGFDLKITHNNEREVGMRYAEIHRLLLVGFAPEPEADLSTLLT